jgi:hypothetical protein
MTRKLNTLFAAAAILTGITTATAVFAADSTSTAQPSRTQVMMTQMSPDQMAQMTTITTDRSNATTASVYHFHGTHPGGTESR